MDILLEMIGQAQRPFVICGGGVVLGRADKEFKAFAEKLDAPVAISLMGGGGFSGSHPLTTGMIGPARGRTHIQSPRWGRSRPSKSR